MLGEKPAEEIDVAAAVERHREARLARIANAIRPLDTQLRFRAEYVAEPSLEAEVEAIPMLPPSVPRPIGRTAISSELF